jgi:hypothetical protein
VQRQYMLLDRYHDEKAIKAQSRSSLNDNGMT